MKFLGNSALPPVLPETINYNEGGSTTKLISWRRLKKCRLTDVFTAIRCITANVIIIVGLCRISMPFFDLFQQKSNTTFFLMPLGFFATTKSWVWDLCALITRKTTDLRRRSMKSNFLNSSKTTLYGTMRLFCFQCRKFADWVFHCILKWLTTIWGDKGYKVFLLRRSDPVERFLLHASVADVGRIREAFFLGISSQVRINIDRNQLLLLA